MNSVREFWYDVDMLIPMTIYAAIVAYAIAKLEIQIEGSHGWAKDLPTYRVSNFFSKLILNEAKMTGYHIWLNFTLMLLAHFPFIAGLEWTFATEFMILGVFFFGAILEDYFWFIFNPAFGIKSFNKTQIHWHRWIGPVPVLYLIYGVLSALFLSLSR